jgi:hypothetical protein
LLAEARRARFGWRKRGQRGDIIVMGAVCLFWLRRYRRIRDSEIVQIECAGVRSEKESLGRKRVDYGGTVDVRAGPI